MPPTIHLIAPFHTITNTAHSHCAFTQKALRFSKMMHLAAAPYHVIEYSNEGSESEADEHVVMLTADEYRTFYKPETSSPGAQANINTPGCTLFKSRLVSAIEQRARMGDLVAHVFGPSLHTAVVQRFPGLIHVETGIGYPWSPMGAYPIFESEAWRHYQWGRHGNPGGVLPTGNIALTPSRTWVIPNYFDEEDWPLNVDPENSVVFMSRFVVDKGIDMLARVIQAWDRKHPGDGLKFVLAGMGDFLGWASSSGFSSTELDRIAYRGVVTGKDRASLLGSGKAFILPTIFVEPFGGAAVESMLCGTPVLVPSFGAFTETVRHRETGFHCRTVEDYVLGIETACNFSRDDRTAIATETRRRYTLEACAALYDTVFTQLSQRPGIE
jgi:glycosyltransferase involved in cell wall biosynthesis